MKHYLPNTHTITRSNPQVLSRIAIIMAFLVGDILLSPNLHAYENPAKGDTIRGITEAPNIPQKVLYLPLSTWIGPGDIVRIKAFPDTALFISGDYPILENGFAMLPILGLVEVTSISIAGLTESLTKRYAKYLAYPTIQIEPIIRLSFLGGFLKPGIHNVNPMYSFSNALSLAEGPVRDDGLRLLRWERGGKVLANNLTSEVEGTKSLWSLGFKSGDQLCVTLLTQRDRLPVVSLIISTVLASVTLVITLLVLSK